MCLMYFLLKKQANRPYDDSSQLTSKQLSLLFSRHFMMPWQFSFNKSLYLVVTSHPQLAVIEKGTCINILSPFSKKLKAAKICSLSFKSGKILVSSQITLICITVIPETSSVG